MPAVITPTQYIQGACAIGRGENRVLAEEAGSGGTPAIASDAQTSVQKVMGAYFLESAHVPHILLAVAGVDHAAGAEEEQRFEKRVRHQCQMPAENAPTPTPRNM